VLCCAALPLSSLSHVSLLSVAARVVSPRCRIVARRGRRVPVGRRGWHLSHGAVRSAQRSRARAHVRYDGRCGRGLLTLDSLTLCLHSPSSFPSFVPHYLPPSLSPTFLISSSLRCSALFSLSTLLFRVRCCGGACLQRAAPWCCPAGRTACWWPCTKTARWCRGCQSLAPVVRF
jgi:hypothetical protein